MGTHWEGICVAFCFTLNVSIAGETANNQENEMALCGCQPASYPVIQGLFNGPLNKMAMAVRMQALHVLNNLDVSLTKAHLDTTVKCLICQE